MAVIAWVAYLCLHFVVVPGWFVWLYRRSPYALRWLPRNRYDLVESAYGLLTATDPRGLVLFVGTVAYVLLQGRAESRHWTRQQTEVNKGE